MFAIVADLSQALPLVSLALSLLLYWNWSVVTYRVVLVFIWHCATFQAYVMTVIVYDAIGKILHFSWRRWLRAGSREVVVSTVIQLWPTSLSITFLVLYAGSMLDSWTACIITHASLSAWVMSLQLWLQSSRSSNTNSSVWERLQLVVCYTLAAIVLALKWSYLATCDPNADATVPDALRHVNVNVWYAAIVATLGLLWEVLLGLTTAALRVVVRGPVQLPFATHLSRFVLGDSAVVDPHSEEFALICGKLHAMLVLVSAWVYSPPQLPIAFQLALLVRLYLTHRASRKLKAYQSVLDAFPVVGQQPSTGTQPQLPNVAPPRDVSSDDICAICREPLYARDAVRQLPCGHRLHGTCLRPWIVRHPACPLCRYPTTSTESVFSGTQHSASTSSLVSLLVLASPGRSNPGRRDASGARRRRPAAAVAPAPAAAVPPHETPQPRAASNTSATPLATGAVVPPLPLSAEHARGFGGGSVQPLVPRLRMRPPPPASPQTAAPAESVLTTSASATEELAHVEAALHRARTKRQRVLSSIQQSSPATTTTASTPSASTYAEAADQLFSDDRTLMGDVAASEWPATTRARRRE